MDEPCYVCGGGPHKTGFHTYWPMSEAHAEFAKDAKNPGNYSPEAAYVAEHRPY